MNSNSLPPTYNFTNVSSEVSVPGETNLATSLYRLVPPPSAMIGDLPVQTVSFILLGVGAAAPIIFMTIVAVVLRFRSIRIRRHYSKYVLDGERTAWSEDIYMYDAYKTRKPETLFNQERQFPPENTQSSSEPRPGSDFDDLPLDLTIRRFFGSTRTEDPTVSHRSTQNSIEIVRKKCPNKIEIHSNPSLEQTVHSPLTIAPPSNLETVLDVKALASLPGMHTLCNDDAILFSSSGGRRTVEKPGDVSPTASRDSGVRTSLETSDSSCFWETSVVVSRSFQPGTSHSGNSEVFDTVSSIDFLPGKSKCTTFSPGNNSQQMEEETEEEKALRCLDDVLMEYMI